jgi:hypothetical protein
MGMSKVAPRGKPKLYGVSISVSGAEVGKAVSSIRPVVHKGTKSNGFRGNVGEEVKRMSRDDVREVRDYSNAVPGIRSLVSRDVDRRGGMRKSRGRVRM